MTHKLCTRYLDALNEGSLKKVLALFADGAVVVSPLYGTLPAVAFYTNLFADTNRSETTLLNIFRSNRSDNCSPGSNNCPTRADTSIALHFLYKWTLRNATVVTFECVDVFEITPDGHRFTKLTIIYDTAPIRELIN